MRNFSHLHHKLTNQAEEFCFGIREWRKLITMCTKHCLIYSTLYYFYFLKFISSQFYYQT